MTISRDLADLVPTLKEVSGNLLVGTTSASTPSSTGFISTANTFGFKNRIINGAMVIDQRNTGAAVTTNGAFPVDRFLVPFSTDGAFSAQQDSSAPVGFVNSVKWTTTTADATLGATQYALFRQKIEGNNVADLGFGTANAKTITLSFWVRSSLTGTFGGAIANSAQDRCYPFSYTISVANTWEQKSITIAGDTTGTWLTTNGIGIDVLWGLGVGSTYSGTAGAWAGSTFLSATGATSVIGTLNATWYITGVQLEVGSCATSFDYRPYGTELALCQRYFISYGGSAAYEVVGTTGIGYSTTYAFSIVVLPVEMRSTPTLTTTGTFNWSDYAATYTTGALTISAGETSTKHAFIFSNGTASSITQYRPYMLIAANSTASRIGLSAEL